MGCEVGFTGPNCSLPCRYPGYGRDCQSECKCIKIFCNASTGCIEQRNTHQEIGNLTDSLNVTGSLGKDATLPITTVVMTPVGIVCVVLVILLAVYVWRKQKANKQDMNKKGKKSKARNVEELLNRRSLCSDNANENLYEDMIEPKKVTDNCRETDKGNFQEKGCLEENAYEDSLVFKREMISQKRESQHLYDPMSLEEDAYVDSLAFKKQKISQKRESQHLYDPMCWTKPNHL